MHVRWVIVCNGIDEACEEEALPDELGRRVVRLFGEKPAMRQGNWAGLDRDNNGLGTELRRPLPVICWDWTGGLRAFASARAVGGNTLRRVLSGAGAQWPQASVTSRNEQLE